MIRNAGFRIVFPSAARMNWLQRVLAFVLLASVAVLGFFFLAVALVTGAMLAAVVVLRWWWTRRKLRGAAGTGIYEGEYAVIEQARERDAASPVRPGPTTLR
jgi:hypothetical protein